MPRIWTKSRLGVSTMVHSEKVALICSRTEDPATAIKFPERLKIPSRPQLPTCQLLGIGVRKVSFLGINVYSVALYADIDQPGLKVRPVTLTDCSCDQPHFQIPIDVSFEEQINYIIDHTTCILRISQCIYSNYPNAVTQWP
jgi:hypothetical protein